MQVMDAYQIPEPDLASLPSPEWLVDKRLEYLQYLTATCDEEAMWPLQRLEGGSRGMDPLHRPPSERREGRTTHSPAAIIADRRGFPGRPLGRGKASQGLCPL